MAISGVKFTITPFHSFNNTVTKIVTKQTIQFRSINFARSCVSHESQFISQISSYCIHFARCNSPMGLNMLFCADRFKTNIDGILHGSCNYIVYSYYNRSIADLQLRASCFLSELISTRDSRQSYFGNVAVTRAQLTDIINHICSS